MAIRRIKTRRVATKTKSRTAHVLDAAKVVTGNATAHRRRSEAKQGNASSDAFACVSSISAGDKDAWVLDSGASDHMSHRREWFENFTEISVDITIGDGTKIKARGKGDINILAFNGDEWIRKHMVNVLYVPDIHLNLFSSGKAMDRGYQFRSDNKRCELVMDGAIVAVGARREKLFQMLFKVVQPLLDDQAIANVAMKKV